jgi:hypothetical protein
MILILISIFWLNSFSQETDSDCSYFVDSITNRKVYTFVDKMPEFANHKEFLVNLVSNIKIDSSFTIFDTKGQIEFIVETDGNVSNVAITDKINHEIDKEVLDFVVKSKWEAGYCNKSQVPVKMTIPYRFDFQ